MKKIQLGGHRYKNRPIRDYALVDDEDFEWLNQWKWSKTGAYAGRYQANKGTKRMHRLIMNCPKGMEVDHIDGNPLNNQRNNLRICTGSQNLCNLSKKKGTSSIYKGVNWNKKYKEWHSKICLNYKIRWIGSFKSELHAAMAYDMWAKDLFGEFAKLNFHPQGETNL